MRRAVAALAVLALAGCGAESPDLFAVERSGDDPAAKLRMVVSDGGTVTCNGTEHTLPAERLLEARELTRRLAEPARLHLDLPPGPGSVLSYRVRLEAGTLSFADTSADLPRELTELQRFTKDVAEDVCGLNR